jgi:hypothetical protein
MAIATPATVQKDRNPKPVGYGRSMIEAEHDAQQLLAKAWKRWGPAGIYLPIDPVEIALNLGLKVLKGDGLGPGESAWLKKEAGFEDPTIFLDRDDSRSRKRFLCAHELGHYVESVKKGIEDEWEFIDLRRPIAIGFDDPEEAYANHFAAELVMPRAVVSERAADSNAVALAAEFGVTGDVMRFRLDQLGLA